jgi:hypothetical protein
MGLVAVLAYAAGAASVAADPPPPGAAVSADVQYLPWRREVDLRGLPPDAWAEVWEDSTLATGTAAAFADVRVIDASGVAQSFTRRDPARNDVWYAALATTVRRDGDREVVEADLGGRVPAVLAVKIRGASHGTQLVVQASDDSTQWRDMSFPGVGPQAPGAEEIVGVGAVSARWVRVVAPGLRGARPITAPRPDVPPPPPLPDATFAAPRPMLIELVERRERPTPRIAVPFRIVRERFEGRAWIAEIEIDAPLALCRLVVSPRAALARHDVRVEGRLSEGGWRDLVHATIESVPLADGTRRIDAVEWDPMRTTALRLRIGGADAPNAPVAIDSLARTPVRFAFPVPPVGEGRWLAYGDAQLLPAHFALDDATLAAATFARARLGPVEPNPLHRPPGFGLAWLQRHPAALTAVLVAILGLVAALVLRRPSPR